jgi:two-component system, NtrC family, nitrogen regulation response regulator NtrX
MSRETILVVDDEESIRKSLVDIFTDEGYEVLTAGSGAEGVEMLRKYQPALAIIDVVLPGSDGIEILQQFKEIRPAMPVIMISGHGTVDITVKAMKAGAADFIEKPLTLDRLSLAVQTALRRAKG